jgi:DNA repair exonuclease SbcCD ATPase subunit
MTLNISEANDGFIVGADPKEPPRTTEQWGDVLNETTASSMMGQQGQTEEGQGQPPVEQPSHRYTDEDLERVRREEKDKLYGRISQMDEQLKSIQKEREEAEAERRAQVEAEAEARRREEEEKMEVRDLLRKKEEEFNARLAEVESQREADRMLLEKERRFTEIEQYRIARTSQESEFIIPELRDLIRGNDENEIDASIEEMKARTAAIMGNISGAVQDQRQAMRGASPTAPPVGPMEQMESYQSLTPEDIGSMDMETYKKHRERLLRASASQYTGR